MITLYAPRTAILLTTLGLLACGVIPSLGVPGDDSAGAASSSATPTSGTTGDAGAKGIDCITEPTTGHVICTGISSCPGLLVDHDVYPNCGFRPGGDILDIECACQGMLCPAGVAKTCAEANRLLEDQTEMMVCAQIAENRCTGAAKPTTTTSPTCDKQCVAECGGAPNCISMCGC